MKCNYCNSEIPEDSKFCPKCGKTIDTITNHRKKQNLSLKAILSFIAIGLWIIVLQNIGVIPITQNVHVKNTVDVSGDIHVTNPVDVNLQEINGRSDVFFNNPKRGDKDKYYLIPVTVE